MPSYYDSTKSKPGKATLKYKEGGQVSDKESALLKALEAIGAISPAIARGAINWDKTATDKAKKIKGGRRAINWDKAVTDKAKKKKRRKGASLGQLSDKQLALLKKDVLKPTKAKAAFKAAGGGKVKKMAGGGTIARGSGAARPQKFHKNG